MIPATTQHHYSFLFKKNYKKCHYTLILENRAEKSMLMFSGFEKEKSGRANMFHFVNTANQNPDCSSGEAVWLSCLGILQQQHKNC